MPTGSLAERHDAHQHRPPHEHGTQKRSSFKSSVQLAAAFVLTGEGPRGRRLVWSFQSARRAGLRIVRINTPKALTPAPAMTPGQGLTMTPAGRSPKSMS